MDEKDFVLLRTLYECGNITHAADKLYLTQSALSKRIKAIERDLGCEIIIRTRKGVRFTPEGEMVLAHTNTAQKALETLRDELSAAQGEVSGTLRAGFSINYSFVNLPSLLAEYNRLYPQVHLEVTSGQSRHLLSSLQQGELDIAVLRGDLPWDGMQYLLAQEQIYVACTAEHAETPLSELTYINHTTDLTHTSLMNRWLRENGLAIENNSINVSDLSTCQELVRRGVGWALLPEIVLRDFDGVMRPCTFENGEPFVRRMYIDCPRESEYLPQVQALIKLIKEQYNQAEVAHAVATEA